MISLSEIENKKNTVVARVEKHRDQLISLPHKNIRAFGIQDIISSLLAEKLPLRLKRIFK